MPRGTDRRAGQAGVEHLGIVLAVAALVGLVGAFVAREIRPPAHPPAFVDSAVRPLDRAADPGGAPRGPAGAQPPPPPNPPPPGRAADRRAPPPGAPARPGAEPPRHRGGPPAA